MLTELSACVNLMKEIELKRLDRISETIGSIKKDLIENTEISKNQYEQIKQVGVIFGIKEETEPSTIKINQQNQVVTNLAQTKTSQTDKTIQTMIFRNDFNLTQIIDALNLYKETANEEIELIID